MRLKLTFTSNKEVIKLPVHYHHFIQGMLYRNLPDPVSDFLHNIGFFYKKRQFKLFTFSKIFSKGFKIVKDEIKGKIAIFNSPITLYISSAISDYPKEWAEKFIVKDKIFLEKNELFLQQIEVLKPPEFKNFHIVKTLSPITVYRTFNKPDEKKYQQFYFPQNSEFSELLKENIRKKYEIITGRKLQDFTFSITPAGKVKIKKLKFKDTLIQGVEGIFKIKLEPEIFKAIYDAGLGAKNSQGFGMVEIL